MATGLPQTSSIRLNIAFGLYFKAITNQSFCFISGGYIISSNYIAISSWFNPTCQNSLGPSLKLGIKPAIQV